VARHQCDRAELAECYSRTFLEIYQDEGLLDKRLPGRICPRVKEDLGITKDHTSEDVWKILKWWLEGLASRVDNKHQDGDIARYSFNTVGMEGALLMRRREALAALGNATTTGKKAPCVRTSGARLDKDIIPEFVRISLTDPPVLPPRGALNLSMDKGSLPNAAVLLVIAVLFWVVIAIWRRYQPWVDVVGSTELQKSDC
jgi:hypothetical protein